VVAHLLAGLPLPGFGVLNPDDRIKAVALETDDPVDDVRIEYTSGARSLVQAKRTLKKGPQFESAVAQWVNAAKQGLDPNQDRLVIVAGRFSGPLQVLQQVLDRFKAELLGELTGAELQELTYLDTHLRDLDNDQKLTLLRCASIHRLDVEEPWFEHSREATLLIGTVVRPDYASRAWQGLISAAGRAARLRGGFDVRGWLQPLVDQGIEVRTDGASPAADAERHRQVLRRYLDSVIQRGRNIDLRSLGADLPPLPLEVIDSGISVLTDPDDSRSTSPLIWSFLRRGRAILTGLPGAGKSTALRVLAAQLAELDEGFVPILVSLKEAVASKPPDEGLLDRILAIATRDVLITDRPVVRQEMERLLVAGQITLLLDGLDETYSRRGQVVSEIDSLLEMLPANIEVLLATRDVGYAQAQTLGWSPLRVAGPSYLDRMLEAILRVGSDQTFTGASSNQESKAELWFLERRTWVQEALAKDPTLSETPLLPTLLALLAAGSSTQSLPDKRAAILASVVDDVVKRRESKRAQVFRLGDLEGSTATHAALRAFEIEGSRLVANDQTSTFDSLQSEVGEALKSDFDLSDGRARAVSEDAIHFWDESGIFVMSGAERALSARVQLFAEIGAARYASKLTADAVAAWVAEMADAGALEALILASGLSPAVASSFATLAVSRRDRLLLLAVVRGIRDGATLHDGDRDAVIALLLHDASIPDREGWESWSALETLGPQGPDVAGLAQAAATYPSHYETVALALLDLHFKDKSDLTQSPERLLAVLKVKWLDGLPSRHQSDPHGLRALAVDRRLAEAVEGAAEVLLGVDESAGDLVLEYLDGGGSMGVQEKLSKLLLQRGFGAQYAAVMAPKMEEFRRSIAAMLPMPFEQAIDFLKIVSEHSSEERLAVGWRRLDELAKLVTVLDLNAGGTWLFSDLFQRGVERFELFARLTSVDLGRSADEARVLLARMEPDPEDHGPFFALFDPETPIPDIHWNQVDDVEQVAASLVEMLAWGLGSAQSAARLLWDAPVVDQIAPKLRQILSRLVGHPRHERLAALTLASLEGIAEPDIWATSDDPVLRAVAAQMCQPVSDARVTPVLRSLLHDSDGWVRIRAIESLANEQAADRDEVLQLVADSPNPGWICISCATSNEAGRSGCAKEGCFAAGPDPATAAQRLLQEMSVGTAPVP
jgi:hypothetical protein